MALFDFFNNVTALNRYLTVRTNKVPVDVSATLNRILHLKKKHETFPNTNRIVLTKNNKNINMIDGQCVMTATAYVLSNLTCVSRSLFGVSIIQILDRCTDSRMEVQSSFFFFIVFARCTLHSLLCLIFCFTYHFPPQKGKFSIRFSIYIYIYRPVFNTGFVQRCIG